MRRTGLEIVETLARYADSDYARVFAKEHFYFNKQAIRLTNVDDAGRSPLLLIGCQKAKVA